SPIVFEIAKKYGVDYLFVKSIIQRESGRNPLAVGDGGDSFGFMQVSSGTASKLGCDTKFKTDPKLNVECGVKYIRDLMDIQKRNNLKLGIRNIAGGYNCGDWAMFYSKDVGYQDVAAWENPANCWSKDRKTNTRIYVDKIMEVYNALYSQIR
ncbi:lytic transglycosylase domain-containing protein, partial [Candidatus Woesearchaeota archaeon]|nr:lytic transglycosylase domain-containing protein [Candidatus Woesearchaeota archaeon]